MLASKPKGQVGDRYLGPGCQGQGAAVGLLLLVTYPDAFIDRPRCRDAQRMAIQTPFAKKVAGSLELQRLLLTRALTVIASSPPPPGSASHNFFFCLQISARRCGPTQRSWTQSHPRDFHGPKPDIVVGRENNLRWKMLFQKIADLTAMTGINRHRHIIQKRQMRNFHRARASSGRVRGKCPCCPNDPSFGH